MSDTVSKNIKQAIVDFLYEKLNSAYNVITKDTVKMFKVASNWDFDVSQFAQYNENGSLTLDQYFEQVPYIPTAVMSIVGDRQLIPNTYIADIIVPISMFVKVEEIDKVEDVLAYFSDMSVGQTYEIKAKYQNELVNYLFSFSVDLPDFDDFRVLQGINGKEINFQLSGTLTQGGIYGDDFNYYLSYDGGLTYELLTRISPTSVRKFNNSSDQIVNDTTQRAIEQDNKWSMSLTLFVREKTMEDNSKTSITRLLLPIIDSVSYYEDENIEEYKDILDNLVLKIAYKEKIVGDVKVPEYQIVKNVILSSIGFAPDYGDFLVINITLEDKIDDENIIEI